MSLTREKAQLMSASEIDRTLVRLAHEILEKTKDLDKLAFIGIRRRGVPLAQRLAKKIEAIEKRTIKGVERDYLVLRVAQGDLTVRVPSENVDLVGVRDVYLAPEAVARIQPHPEREPVSDFVIPLSILMDLLTNQRAVVYTPDAGRLRAVTLSYYVEARRHWDPGDPRRVDVGQAAFARQLGPSWYEVYQASRASEAARLRDRLEDAELIETVRGM